MDSRVVTISGKQGSGKTTLAKELERWAIARGWAFWSTKFAAPLYSMHDAVLEILELAGIQTPEKDGALLQLLGTDWGRKYYGEDIWAKITRGKVDRELKHFEERNHRILIAIDDCRFPNELNMFHDSIKIKLEAPRVVRKARTEGWRDNEDHPSETALDHLPNTAWDKVFLTSGENSLTPEEIAKIIAETFLFKGGERK